MWFKQLFKKKLLKFHNKTIAPKTQTKNAKKKIKKIIK